MVTRFDVYLINLDERITADPKNTRPAVVVSPDELNRNLSTVIIAPISSSNVGYPTRVPIDLLNSPRFVILDQLQTIDTDRLVKKIAEVEKEAQLELTERLLELFA